MFLRTGAFFSSILSEFLKNLVALHKAWVEAEDAAAQKAENAEKGTT